MKKILFILLMLLIMVSVCSSNEVKDKSQDDFLAKYKHEDKVQSAFKELVESLQFTKHGKYNDAVNKLETAVGILEPIRLELESYDLETLGSVYYLNSRNYFNSGKFQLAIDYAVKVKKEFPGSQFDLKELDFLIFLSLNEENRLSELEKYGIQNILTESGEFFFYYLRASYYYQINDLVNASKDLNKIFHVADEKYILHEYLLLHDLIKVSMNSKSISYDQLTELEKGEDGLNEVTLLNIKYLKLINCYEKKNEPEIRTILNDIKNTIEINGMEYNYNSINLYNVLTETQRQKLARIESEYR